MILLVPELHPVNAPLCWLLARVASVQALYVHPTCAWLLGGRLTQLDPSRWMSYREGWDIRNAAAGRWGAVRSRMPAGPWRARVRGLDLDFSGKAGQDAAQAFQDGCLLEAIRRRQPAASSAWIIPSAALAWLSGFDPGTSSPATPRAISWIARVNMGCDRLWLWMVNAVRVGRLLVRFAGALARRLRPSRQTLQPCRYLYWCDGAVDFRHDAAKRSLWWIVDHQAIQLQDVVVLLPQVSRDAWRREPDCRPPHQAFTLPECYARLPAAALWQAVGSALALLVRNLCQPAASLERLWMTGYLTAVAQLRPISDTVRPACYIECDNSLGIEDPALVYLNAVGVATVMYHTSAMMPSTKRPAAVRDLMHAEILASAVVCWSQAAVQFLTAHVQQPRTRFEVLAPILPGSDALLDRGQPELRRMYVGARTAARADLTYLSAFDVAPLLRAGARTHHDRPYPEPFPETATIAFLRDLVRLLTELPELALIYKPKRLDALERRFPTRLAEYRQLLQLVRTHERGTVLDSEANPWIPLALADVCVAMPDSSPSWAALHYGIPAFFHDPLRMRVVEDEALSGYYTDNYPALRAKVRQVVDAEPMRGRREWVWTPEMLPLLGQPPGSNGNAAFRAWLSEDVQRFVGMPGGASMARRPPVEAPASMGLGRAG